MPRQIPRLLAAFVLLPRISALASGSAEPTHGYWVGTVGDFPAQMDLDTTGAKPAGSYVYERTGMPLTLTGTVESDGTLRLTEQTAGENVTGFFRSAAPSEGRRFSGIWTAADGSKSLPFRFREVATFGVMAVPPAADLQGTFRYPVFAASDDGAMQLNAEIERFTKARRDEFLESAAAARTEGHKSHDAATLKPAWTAELNWEVHYFSSNLVSLLANTAEFTGGAHGSIRYATLNYRLHDGKATPINLKDLFLPTAHYLPALSRICASQLKAKEAAWLMSGEVKNFTEEELSTFLLGPDGIAFVFAPYQVGPWAQRTFRVTVAYRDLKGLLDPEGPCSRFTSRAIVATAAKHEPKLMAVAEAKPATASIKATRKPVHLDKPLSETDAVRMIAELPEVRRYFSTVEQTSHKQGRAIAMGQGHGGDANAWEVYVGEEHPDHSACWNRFRVDQRTGAILVWNAPNYNAVIPLELWREQQSARASGD